MDEKKIRTLESVTASVIVEAPSGHAYEIRPLRTSEIHLTMGSIQDLAAAATGETKKARVRQAIAEKVSDPGERDRIQERVVMAGLVSPKIENADLVWGLGIPDVGFLFTNILSLSGLGTEAAKAIDPLSGTEGASSSATSSALATDGAPASS